MLPVTHPIRLTHVNFGPCLVFTKPSIRLKTEVRFFHSFKRLKSCTWSKRVIKFVCVTFHIKIDSENFIRGSRESRYEIYLYFGKMTMIIVKTVKLR